MSTMTIQEARNIMRNVEARAPAESDRLLGKVVADAIDAHLRREVKAPDGECDHNWVDYVQAEYKKPHEWKMAESDISRYVKLGEMCDKCGKERKSPAPEAKVPDGWKLVPVEPTAAMEDAAFDTFEIDDAKTQGFNSGTDARNAIYKAMLAAAPTSSGKVPDVYVCSNPKCNAVRAKDPNGHCPVCVQPSGVGYSTMRKEVL